MMSQYRVRNRVLLAKVELTTGTDASPTVVSDAILVANPQWTPNFEVLETDEVGASLDDRGPIVGGGNIGHGFEVFLKGAGVGGVVPEFGALLQGCAMAETVTAADITGTAQAGDVDTITLAAGESAVDDTYKGMVIAITGGTGSGQSRVIGGYDGTTKVATVIGDWDTQPDATSQYTIHANVLYRPASTDLKTLTLYEYQRAVATGTNALLRKVIGAAGTFSLEVTTRQLARLSFEFTGILPALPANVADPASPTYDSIRPPPFINAEARLGGSLVKFNRFSLDYGGEVQQPDDPGALYGYDVAGVTARQVSGSINPNLTLLSSRNNLQDFLDGNERSIVLRWGQTAGNRVSLFVPSARYTGATPGDVNGYTVEEVPFRAVGFDQGVYVCLH
jgi:hypothetical protein